MVALLSLITVLVSLAFASSAQAQPGLPAYICDNADITSCMRVQSLPLDQALDRMKTLTRQQILDRLKKRLASTLDPDLKAAIDIIEREIAASTPAPSAHP